MMPDILAKVTTKPLYAQADHKVHRCWGPDRKPTWTSISHEGHGQYPCPLSEQLALTPHRAIAVLRLD